MNCIDLNHHILSGNFLNQYLEIALSEMCPLVSVIIPNYNHAAFLQQRIDSVLSQTFQDFEVIILDDCSNDESGIIIENYRGHPKIAQIEYNKVNSGSVFKQWEKGIALANGSYIWIAESDDWASPNFLEKIISILNNNPDVGLAFCGSNWVDDNGLAGKDLSIYQEDFKRAGRDELKNLLKRNTIQNASSVVLRKSVVVKNIAGITFYTACGDWFLYMNVLSESNVVYLSQKLNNFRWYHNNTSNKAAKDGRWVREGLNIIRYSKGYKAKLSAGEIRLLYRFWQKKANKLKMNFFYKNVVLPLMIFVFWYKSHFAR